MKKVFCILLGILVCVGFVSCTTANENSGISSSSKSGALSGESSSQIVSSILESYPANGTGSLRYNHVRLEPSLNGQVEMISEGDTFSGWEILSAISFENETGDILLSAISMRGNVILTGKLSYEKFSDYYQEASIYLELDEVSSSLIPIPKPATFKDVAVYHVDNSPEIFASLNPSYNEGEFLDCKVTVTDCFLEFSTEREYRSYITVEYVLSVGEEIERK